jgi:oxygen-independent coproporphyrinogen-3 oxidase
MFPRHVYVHVPFCARRCAYCDFSIAVRARVPVDEYLAGLAAELELRLGPPPAATERPRVASLYFGGGTPSRLGGAGVAQALDLLRRWVEPEPDAEITVEANPDDVDASAVATWRAAGVNRLSLGGQTFSPAALAWMRRTHSGAQTERAVDVARSGGLDDLSLDLIFALPASVERDWPRTSRARCRSRQRTFRCTASRSEPGTPLARWHDRGEVSEADEDRYADEFLHAHDALAAAGFVHYEVSNFALRVARRATTPATGRVSPTWDSARRPTGSMARGDAGTMRRTRPGCRPYAPASTRRPGARRVTSRRGRLRTSTSAFAPHDGLRLHEEERARAARWVAAGWATLVDGYLRLTPTGWLRLDAIAADLTALRSRS